MRTYRCVNITTECERALRRSNVARIAAAKVSPSNSCLSGLLTITDYYKL